MDSKDYLKYWFDRAWRDIDADVDGLTEQELERKPQGAAHSIKALYYHMIEAVEGWHVGTLEGRSYEWGRKFGPWWEGKDLPPLSELKAYRDEVHERFVTYFDSVAPDDLVKEFKVFGGEDKVPQWWVFGHLLEHFHRHWGQIRMMIRMMGREPQRI